MSGLGMAGQLAEGVWRGGIRPAFDPMFTLRGRPEANAEMLERFAGVHPGGGETDAAFAASGAPNGSGLSLMSGLGLATGLYGFGTGLYDLVYGDTTKKRALGGANMVTSGIGALGSAANIAGASGGFLGGLTSMGGAGLGGMGLAGNAFSGATWVGTAAGGGGLTAAGIGTLATTVGAVAGAGLGGFGFGEFADDMTKKHGLLAGLESGRNSDGSAKSISDWGGDIAAGVDERVTSGLAGDSKAGSLRRTLAGGAGSALGFLTTLGTSAVGVPLAAAMGFSKVADQAAAAAGYPL